MKRFGLALGIAVALPLAAHAQGRVIPFTTWQAEQQAVANSLDCKWVSVGGKFAGGRYDFLCKGGVWATVSLFMDKAGGMSDGVGSVRLHYRDWDVNVHPNAGEASIAQKFLVFVVDRFVPSSAAPSALEAFWGEGSRSWSGGGVQVTYAYEKGKGFGVRKLEVRGTGRTLVGAKGVVTREEEKAAAPQVVTPTDGGLLKQIPPKPLQAEEHTVPVVAPVQWRTPAPVAPAPEQALPQPREGGVINRVRELLLPEGMKKEPTPLEKASPAELLTSPEPKSQEKPEPPVMNKELVPDSKEMILGREKAPSNFDAYNRAESLTRDIEMRAFDTVKKDKVVPADEASRSQAQDTLKAPAAQPGEPVKALPTPEVGGGSASTPRPADEPGKQAPVRLETNEGAGWSGGLSVQGQPSGRTGGRPLPQLKFVPKAEPLSNPGEVIRFEDEKSKL